MRRFSVSCLIGFFLAASISASTLPELLQKAKTDFRHGAYTHALAVLDELEQESLKEGYEQDRVALTPVLAFYRGASYAALNRSPEAREQFEIFLPHQPDAVLDPAVYPKKVIEALEGARKSLKSRGEEPVAAGSNSLRLSYATFRVQRTEEEGSLGEDWADGSMRFLLTSEERQGYTRLLDPVTRSEYVTNFWKSRDPKPETATNEFRDEFERRVAFADARFTQGETRGSVTDRGMVFILLGPPTYVGRKPLTTEEDTHDNPALNRFRRADVRIAAVPSGTRKDQVARVDRVTGPGNTMNDAASNWREVWHYRREHLPKGVPYLQVDFDFVTKQGYGENVLQRDTQVLDTLERVKSKLREGKA
jgi:GWxTD domain-containing protein